MKKIFAIAITLILAQTALFAQSGKSVSEKDVPERYVKDMKRQVGEMEKVNVEWKLIDTLIYDACYVNENGTKTVLRFSPKGTETRWYVEEKYYPHAIVNNIADTHPGYKIKELYALQIRNKVTYQVLVGQRKGFFTKKWKNMRLMNYETDYKFIDEIEL